MYTLRHDPFTGAYIGVTRQSDGAQVPADPDNGDYSAFLAWNAQQAPPLDLSDRPAESGSERLARVRAEALSTLLTRPDDTGIAVRASIAAVTFLVNDRLELIDQQLRALGAAGIPAPVRVLEAEVLAYLMAHPTAGDPAPG